MMKKLVDGIFYTSIVSPFKKGEKIALFCILEPTFKRPGIIYKRWRPHQN